MVLIKYKQELSYIFNKVANKQIKLKMRGNDYVVNS